jgi:type IV pilus assembly protein PilM
MAKNIVTLYIDDRSLRVTVTRGERVKEWAHSPLDPGLVVKNVVANPAALASKIKQMFKTLKLKGNAVSVGLSGLHCLNRLITLPQLPKDMLAEAVRREAKRVLPMPLDQLYLSWQLLRSEGGQQKIFLVALPMTTVDSVADAMRQAGLRLNFMGIKPLLLARTVAEPTALVVDAQSTEFDITIMVNGIPQTIRTVPFPGDGLSVEDKIQIVSNELDRTISFYNANNPENQLAAGVHVLTSGYLASGVELCKVLSGKTEHPVVPLHPKLDYPDGFDLALYSANLGLMLYQLHGHPGSSLVTLNSLPPKYQTKSVSLVNISVVPGSVIAVGLIFFLVTMNRSVLADVGTISANTDLVRQTVQDSLEDKRALSADIKQLESKVQLAQAALTNYENALANMEIQRARTTNDFLAVINELPKAIKLSGVEHTGSTLEITGQARAESDVLAYLTDLDSSLSFGEISITNLTKIQDGGIGFTLLVNREKAGEEISGVKTALRYLPPDVSLTSFSQANDTITLNGQSPNEDSIVLFLKNLETSNLFREIALNGKTTNNQGGINFTIFVKM